MWDDSKNFDDFCLFIWDGSYRHRHRIMFYSRPTASTIYSNFYSVQQHWIVLAIFHIQTICELRFASDWEPKILLHFQCILHSESPRIFKDKTFKMLINWVVVEESNWATFDISELFKWDLNFGNDSMTSIHADEKENAVEIMKLYRANVLTNAHVLRKRGSIPQKKYAKSDSDVRKRNAYPISENTFKKSWFIMFLQKRLELFFVIPDQSRSLRIRDMFISLVLQSISDRWERYGLFLHQTSIFQAAVKWPEGPLLLSDKCTLCILLPMICNIKGQKRKLGWVFSQSKLLSTSFPCWTTVKAVWRKGSQLIPHTLPLVSCFSNHVAQNCAFYYTSVFFGDMCPFWQRTEQSTEEMTLCMTITKFYRARENLSAHFVLWILYKPHSEVLLLFVFWLLGSSRVWEKEEKLAVNEWKEKVLIAKGH